MLQATIIYDNTKDRELMSLIDIKFPIFVNYVDMNTTEGRKSGFNLLNYWSAKKLPFVILDDLEKKDSLPKVFYSEITNGVNQLIKFLNGNSSSN